MSWITWFYILSLYDTERLLMKIKLISIVMLISLLFGCSSEETKYNNTKEELNRIWRDLEPSFTQTKICPSTDELPLLKTPWSGLLQERFYSYSIKEMHSKINCNYYTCEITPAELKIEADYPCLRSSHCSLIKPIQCSPIKSLDQDTKLKNACKSPESIKVYCDEEARSDLEAINSSKKQCLNICSFKKSYEIRDCQVSCLKVTDLLYQQHNERYKPMKQLPPIQAAPTIQVAPSPAPTPNNIASDTEKRCDTQTISNEKHLPKWNIEIVDSSVITSMLKDAEKNHLPFLKINASDNLKQKLETYINKEPSKLHENSQNTFTCEPANYIRTASNIGIQLVLCNDNDDEMSVAFLNLVSPVDNKARVYTAKTFDHLFKDAPVIDITEETVINGERAAYIAVKYETYSDGTGHERSETDIVHYLFLGDKLRFLSDWNAFHIVEDWYYYDDGTEEYDCDAKATVLRIESTGAKHQEHSFSISTSN